MPNDEMQPTLDMSQLDLTDNKVRELILKGGHPDDAFGTLTNQEFKARVDQVHAARRLTGYELQLSDKTWAETLSSDKLVTAEKARELAAHEAVTLAQQAVIEEQHQSPL